jgi:glucuronoarabinoxylan endo-1,4-beta-xylanase
MMRIMKYLAFLWQEFDAISLFSFAAGGGTREGSAMPPETRSSGHRKFLATTLAVAFLLFLAGPIDAQAQTATINWTDVHQVIDGFGAANAQTGSALTSSQDSFLFGTGSGQLGLSLLRVGVTDDSTDAGDCTSVGTSCAGPYVSTMQAAIANGGRVYASPWTPPAAYKTNSNALCTAGAGSGALVSGDYGAYATWLVNFVQSLAAQSPAIPLYAISIQNEPDSCTGYDSAVWTNTEIDNFVKNNLGPTFASGRISTLIFTPETGFWRNMSADNVDSGGTYGDTCGTDSACTAYVGGYNFHDYDASLSGTNTVAPDASPSTWAAGKKYWETEGSCYASSYVPNFCQSGYNTDMTDALDWAAVIDQRIAGDGANAWLYWWLYKGGEVDDQALISDTTPYPQRAYMLGQYSKFVRPGYYRIDATRQPQNGVSVSAYRNTGTNTLVIVATNYTDSAVSQTFNITNAPAFSSVTPTQTSASLSLSTLSNVSVSDNSFTYTLPDQSITTFVGTTLAPSAPINLSTTVVAN